MRFKISTMLLSTAVMSCSAISGEFKNLNLGSNNFCIPKTHDILDQTSGPILSIGNSDTDNSTGTFQVAIDESYVQRSVSEYKLTHGNLDAVFFVNLTLVPQPDIERALSPTSNLDLLTLSEEYSAAPVQFDENDEIYRVNELSGEPPFIIWHVLKVAPNKSNKLENTPEDYYVAYCSRAGGHEGTSSNCEYSFEYDGYLAQVKTTENNLDLKPALTSYAINLFEAWKNNCASQ